MNLEYLRTPNRKRIYAALAYATGQFTPTKSPTTAILPRIVIARHLHIASVGRKCHIFNALICIPSASGLKLNMDTGNFLPCYRDETNHLVYKRPNDGKKHLTVMGAFEGTFMLDPAHGPMDR